MQAVLVDVIRNPSGEGKPGSQLFRSHPAGSCAVRHWDR